VPLGEIVDTWVDAATSRLEFIGVTDGGETLCVIPVEGAGIDDQARLVSVPFSQEHVLKGPPFPAGHTLTDEDEVAIYAYYDMERSTEISPTGYVEDNRDFRESEHYRAAPPEVER